MKDKLPGQLLYRQIYEDLKAKIIAGEIAIQQHLPPIPELSSVYGVSEAPVRRALDDLAREGLIVKSRGRGRGTIVTKRPVAATLRVLLIAGFNLQKSSIETCHEVFDLLAGIEAAALEMGCRVQQVSSNGFDSLPDADPMTGYLIIGMNREEYQQGMRLAALHRAPSVLVNPPCAGGAAVRVDIEQGGYLATDHLAQLGHRRIAYIGGTRTEWLRPRFSGYQQALAASLLQFDDALVRETDGVEPGQDWQALESLLALPDPPTAIFAASDYRALHLMAYCRQNSISVPQQLSICGYDDIREVAGVEPAVTTVHHPRQELGKIAVALLTDLLLQEKNKDTFVDRVIQPYLVLRESCAPPVFGSSGDGREVAAPSRSDKKPRAQKKFLQPS